MDSTLAIILIIIATFLGIGIGILIVFLIPQLKKFLQLKAEKSFDAEVKLNIAKY